MLLGVAAIALSSAKGQEQKHWEAAAQRESVRYGVTPEYVAARFAGHQAEGEALPSRTPLDWILVAGATAVLVSFAAIARVPEISFQWIPALLMSIVLVILFLVCGVRLWRITRFH
jgi:hypothetical protein